MINETSFKLLWFTVNFKYKWSRMNTKTKFNQILHLAINKNSSTRKILIAGINAGIVFFFSRIYENKYNNRETKQN